MVAARPANAALISASCWAAAAYSCGVRSAQIGSPMMCGWVPGCSARNACSTHGMIRPGLRPATVMSAKRTRSAAGPSASRIRSRFGPGTATSAGCPADSADSRNGTVPAR